MSMLTLTHWLHLIDLKIVHGWIEQPADINI
uniref:Uncharacterized protein n=1 Tax=Tetranychus urticae TaxID=32264 RepID=T1KS57_TETUR